MAWGSFPGPLGEACSEVLRDCLPRIPKRSWRRRAQSESAAITVSSEFRLVFFWAVIGRASESKLELSSVAVVGNTK